MARTRGTARRSYQPQGYVSNRVSILVARMKKERLAAMKAPRLRSIGKLSTNVQEYGTFPLLALPRELRDEIYSHTVGSRSKDSTMMFDSVRTQAHNHLQRRRSRRNLGDKHSISPVLYANRQLHQESMETVFRESIFFVTMDLKSPILRSQTKREGDEEAAVPFGWDLSKIRNMSLRLDLGRQEDIVSALKGFQFPHMRFMQKLSVLRLVVTVWTQPGQNTSDPPMVFLENTVGNDAMYPEATAFRTMLRDLRNAIPDSVHKLEFGLSCTSDELKPKDWCVLSACSVPGEKLRSIFKDSPKSEDLASPEIMSTS